MEKAENVILSKVQKQAYPEEMRDLMNVDKNIPVTTEKQSKPHVKRSSTITKLDPILLGNLIRVGGRLSMANIPEDSKHQIILPKNHHVTTLLIRHYHNLAGHSGRQHVLSLLRERYWIIKANSAVRRVLNDCISCRKRQASPGQQKMADLPVDRTLQSKPPFTAVGLDYFGPIQVRRGRALVKRYGVIFTCLSIRAVHIEVAHSLDTDSFIMALRRFISRRGQVKEIRSDNGTNLTGGEKELREALKEWNQETIHNHLLQKNIKWTFNPPYASHFGGVWERCIRTIRKVLNAILKEQRLDDKSLQTYMCEVESIINGRPLTAVSDDPSDLQALTPNRLLLLKDETPLPPGLFQKEDNYSKRRWKQVQLLANTFWKRWSKEYLPLLQERAKWTQPRKNYSVGDIVLIYDQNMPRNQWPLGRIIQVHVDKKGYARSAKIKLRNTVAERPITKLCHLMET